MNRALYVWKSPYPWEVRIDKICKSLYQNDFDVYLLARWSEGQPERETIDNINIIRAGFNKPRYYSTPLSSNPLWKKSISKLVSEIKPSVIIPREIMLAEACGKIGKKFGIPVIMDMAEHYPAAMKGWDKYYKNIFKRIAVHYLNIPEKIESKSLKLMDGIITVCEELSNRLIDKYSVNKEKIQVVYNTPELNWFKDIRTGSSNPPVEFAYHGFMTNDRNLDKMVKGFIIAAQNNSFIRLTLAGYGETYKLLKELADNSDCSDRIIFTGPYDHSDIKNLYSQMDVGIIPFKDNEFINHTIANKFFDYLAAGKPIITSLAKPMVDILNKIQAGISVDCSDENEIAGAILKISEMNLDSMSANGKNAAKNKFNWDTDSKNLIAFINKYIN